MQCEEEYEKNGGGGEMWREEEDEGDSEGEQGVLRRVGKR